MTKVDPTSPLGRHLDIMRQGFMKPLPKQRAPKALPPVVSCCGCLNWHRKGQHTVKDAAQRKANVATLNRRKAFAMPPQPDEVPA